MNHNTTSPPAAAVPSSSVSRYLLPNALTVFVAFLTIGMQLPVLPLHLHQTLGMGTLVVGLVVGAEFAASLLTRFWAGNFADMRGPKRAVLAGAAVAALSGVAYLLSLTCLDAHVASVWILLVGRVLLALGQSLIVTGAMGWGIGLVGPPHAGKVMAWNGIAMYAAYAVGAPFGMAVRARWDFLGVALFAVALPLLALGIAALVKGVAPSAQRRTPFYRVIGAIWVPGTGLALSSVGFGLITAFIALLFAARGWDHASVAFTAFGVAFIGARLLFGHLPDRIGGAKVALVSVLIEALGQWLIWSSDGAAGAWLGAALTGFGYSLAFPGFGVEALRRAPPQTRSLAMGAYAAFLDLALGITSPLAGALAGVYGIASVYLAGTVVVGLSVFIAWRLWAVAPAQPAAQA